MPARILIVEDDDLLAESLERHLRRRGFEVLRAATIAEGLAAIGQAAAHAASLDAICTDLQLPDGDGRAIVKAAHLGLRGCPVIVMSGSATVSSSVEAMRLGAITVLEKPVPLDALESELRQAMQRQGELQGALGDAEQAGIVGASAGIRAVLDLLLLAAPTEATLLIEGETGTGKELAARAAHRLSRRSAGPFVPLNCAALPEALLESELFGHVRGAFTGATESRQGRFRQAHGGTLFLDEIGEMALGVQAKLLRVLQDREVQPLGSDRAQAVDVRLVVATNRDLEAMAAAGTFRSDLFYRLNVVSLRLPPLRERPEDIAILAAHFLRKKGAPRGFAPDALQALQRHAWPGNVRELENLVERLAVLKPAGDVELADLPRQFHGTRPAETGKPAAGAAPQHLPPGGVDLYAVLGELEERLIREALDLAGGNRSEAARYLGLGRTTLIEKLRRMSRS